MCPIILPSAVPAKGAVRVMTCAVGRSFSGTNRNGDLYQRFLRAVLGPLGSSRPTLTGIGPGWYAWAAHWGGVGGIGRHQPG
jgi:hypothetical protein